MKRRNAWQILFIPFLCTIGVAAACTETTDNIAGNNVRTIHVLSGAGLIRPMDELKEVFERQHRVNVVVHYGGPGELMGQLALELPSDVFIPGANKYVQDAGKNGWIADGSTRDIVRHVPVIAVAKKNPKRIELLEDLARPGIRVALGDPEACAIGRVAQAILRKSKIAEKVTANVRVRAPTVNQLLLYVTLGQVDAAIIWEDMVSWAQSNKKLAIVRIPAQNDMIKTISAAVVMRSTQSETAKMFVDFIDSGRGHSIWSKWGFTPCDG